MFNRIAAMTAITLGMTISIFGQNTTLKGEVGKAMGYFQNIGDRDFEDHLRRFDHAFVKLQSRAVLLISDKALNLLSAEELQALAAHEMAHDYFWREYFDAKDHKQYNTLLEIELRCDGIAIITMEYLNLDCSYLISGTERLKNFNARIVPIDHLTHPPAGDRLKFNRAMSEFVKEKIARGLIIARE